jgi:hypothetical protein
MTAKRNIAPLLIANDPGSSGLRLYGRAGFVNQSAHVAADGGGRIMQLAGLTQRKPPLKIESASVPPLYVGDTAAQFGAPIDNLDHDRQTGTPEMKAVLYAALTRYQQAHGEFDAPLNLGVALPNQFITGDEADSNKALVKSWMTGSHTWRADGLPYSVAIADVRPTSQAAAAMFDYLLDDSGDWRPDRKAAFRKEIGVISIGFDTIELMVVNNKAITPAFTAGKKIGARELLRLVDPRGLYSLSELEPQLRAARGALDVSAQLPVWERKITGFIDETWGTTWRRFAAIVIVGGGAILLRDTLPSKFNGKACVPDQPVLAVARGLYKLMLNQHKGK